MGSESEGVRVRVVTVWVLRVRVKPAELSHRERVMKDVWSVRHLFQN